MIIGTILIITEFFGRFHPVLVHLPIGILLMAVIFYFIGVKRKSEDFNAAVKYSLLLGVAAGIFSCMTGYLLSNSGDYDDDIVSKHQWLGITTTVVSAVAYFCYGKKSNLMNWLMPLIVILIIITGHLGGSLTHGEDYLTKGLSSPAGKNVAIKPIPDVQQAVVYNDIIQPILQSKCYNCHGSAKQKGKLRLDEPAFIDKGGEDGKIIIAGKAGESELIERIMLPKDNEDHMPPKQKSQLTKAEIELLNWWVATGADYHKKTTELNQPEKIKPYLASLQTGNSTNEMTQLDIPEEKVNKAPDSIIKRLKEMNVAVSNVSQASNYLSVNFVAVGSVTAQHIQLLQALSKQITWLKLSGTNVSNAAMDAVGKMTSLTKLFLNSSNVTDNNILYLDKLSKLQYLNVSSTAVTVKGINSLSGLKNLRQLYLYQTGIKGEGITNIKKLFPKTMIDTGGYTVQFLPTDTMIVKEKPKKG